MKKKILLLLFLFPLYGCGEKTEEVKDRPSSMEIVDKYVDTLVTAPDKARASANAMEERNEAEERALKELE